MNKAPTGQAFNDELDKFMKNFRLSITKQDNYAQTNEVKKDVGTQTDEVPFQPRVIVPTKYKTKFQTEKEAKKRKH